MYQGNWTGKIITTMLTYCRWCLQLVQLF